MIDKPGIENVYCTALRNNNYSRISSWWSNYFGDVFKYLNNPPGHLPILNKCNTYYTPQSV